MVRPFNVYLRGLLGLLDAKVGGKPPSEFEDTLRVVLDAQQFLVAQRQEVLLMTTAAYATLGTKLDATGLGVVPDSEIWLVHRYSCKQTVVLAAAEFHCFHPTLQGRSTAGTNVTQALSNNFRISTVGDRPIVVAQAPFIALPGDTLGVEATTVTTVGTFTVNMFAAFVRFPT